MNIKEITKNSNIKNTPARLELLEILAKQNRPICYDDVKETLTMDKATFYRNISKFIDENIISSFESNNKKRYFALENSMHPHFICNYCNAIECIEELPTIDLKNYSIENIILKGKCKKCFAKNEGN
ncbi:MAG TPA: transcriptional repressor [Epsilonproteobacteria bacterium]|jgi:Fur family ferric uptake transcriptional regulator|nr:transcriptional repressor [Campylobacterota bacterium]